MMMLGRPGYARARWRSPLKLWAQLAASGLSAGRLSSAIAAGANFSGRLHLQHATLPCFTFHEQPQEASCGCCGIHLRLSRRAKHLLDQRTLHGDSGADANTCRCVVRAPTAETSTHTSSPPPPRTVQQPQACFTSSRSLFHGGSGADHNQCRCVVVVADTLYPSARSRDEHAHLPCVRLRLAPTHRAAAPSLLHQS